MVDTWKFNMIQLPNYCEDANDNFPPVQKYSTYMRGDGSKNRNPNKSVLQMTENTQKHKENWKKWLLHKGEKNHAFQQFIQACHLGSIGYDCQMWNNIKQQAS